MYESFRDCGWAAYLCLLIGFVGLGAGAVGLVLLATRARGAAPVLGAVAVVFGGLAIGSGVLGRESGLRMTEAAISGDSVDAAQKARIRAVGTQEAGECIKVGAAAGALPFVMGAIAVGVGLALRKKTPAG